MTPIAMSQDFRRVLAPEVSPAGPPRRRVPRRHLAVLARAPRDPLRILAAQNATRVPELLPLRAERMSASPFAFYRGTAAIMAADQASDPHSGILVASCGDAHVSNFGFYASPERILLFDLNDFDEAAWAPWEWDVKRLVTSVIIGGRASTRDPGTVDAAALAAVNAYAEALRLGVAMSPVARYYRHFDARASVDTMEGPNRKTLRAAIKDAEKRTGDRAARRLTEQAEDGSWRFIESPPLMTHVEPDVAARVQEAVAQYVRSAYVDIRLLLSQYVLDDVVRRVVGVGSVGTRCYLVLLRDQQGGRLILQVKEALASVLTRFADIPQPLAATDAVEQGGQGARVVSLQRILQAHSDPFLGHFQTKDRDFYVRQFHDRKGSIQVDMIEDAPFVRYATACGVLLARAHVQSPSAAEVDRYIGKGKRITESIVAWSEAYAERSLADYEALIASG